jgi:outer membrane receptor protein involved in Fe transport
LELEDDKRYGATMLEHPPLADAFIGYMINNRWDLQLNLNNLTNERYIVQVAATGLIQGSDTFRSKLTVKFKW